MKFECLLISLFFRKLLGISVTIRKYHIAVSFDFKISYVCKITIEPKRPKKGQKGTLGALTRTCQNQDNTIIQITFK